MRIDARALIVPIAALVVLVLTLQQTLGALRDSGSWRRGARARVVQSDDPYTRIDNLLANEATPLSAERLRNPFAFGAAGAPGTPIVTHAGTKWVRPRPAPPQPALTSIIWDADPRATVRYDGRDFSVRVNTLFADFRVKSITSNEVVLDRNGESIVLTLRPKGD